MHVQTNVNAKLVDGRCIIMSLKCSTPTACPFKKLYPKNTQIRLQYFTRKRSSIQFFFF